MRANWQFNCRTDVEDNRDNDVYIILLTVLIANAMFISAAECGVAKMQV